MSRRGRRSGTQSRVVPTTRAPTGATRSRAARRPWSTRPAVRTARGLFGRFEPVRELALRFPVVSAFLTFAGVIALMRPASWRTPLNQDAGQYLYVGQTILDGGTPYVDAANNKGPLTYLLFAGVRLVSDTSVVAVRATLLLFAALTALAVAGYVARHAGRAVGFVAGFAFAALSGTSVLQGIDPNTEEYGVAPMAAAAFFATRGSRLSAFLAGLCAAAATLMHPAFALVIPIVAYELWRNEVGWGARVRAWGSAAAGGAVLAAPILIWLGLAGALDDMWSQVFGHVSNTVGPGSLAQQNTGDVSHLYRLVNVPAGALWIGGLLGCLVAARTPALRRYAVPAAVWIALVWLRVKVADYELLHQYYLALPAIAIGLAIGIGALWRAQQDRWRWATAALVLTIPIATFALGPEWRALQVPAQDRYGVNSPYALAAPMADFIRSATKPGDPIIVAGAQAQVYWLAHRRAPTRFFDTFPLADNGNYREERSLDLQQHPPRAIGLLPGERLDSSLLTLLNAGRYRVAWEESGARVWLRRG